MRQVPVDMLLLPVPFESHGDNSWYLDLTTGDVLLVLEGEDPELDETIENDSDRFLRIEPPLSGDDFRVMEDFVAGLPSGEARRGLERVLGRAKPFRNFREALRDWPDMQKQWFELQERRTERLATEWLADHDIEPIPRPPRA